MSIKDTLTGMDDESLAKLGTEVSAAIESRRRRFNLEDIKVGMTPEDRDRARAEIAKALKDSGYSK